MQTTGSGLASPWTAKFATLLVTASGHPGNLGLDDISRWEIENYLTKY